MNHSPLPTLDTSATLDRLKGDRDFLETLLRVFLDDLPQKLAALESSLNDGDMETTLRTSHSLKGACATIGATALRQAAQDLENASRKGDAADAREKHAAIPALAEALTRQLKIELA